MTATARHWPVAPGVLHTLHPGDVVCGERGDRLETLLGSCVAIVLTDPKRTVGVMCHIVHSRPAPNAECGDAAHAAAARKSMHRMLTARGITPGLCEAYVYGGGNMFPALITQSHVGDDNARWAFDALARDGVKVLHHDVGGNVYRRLSWTVGHDLPQVTAVQV